MIRHILALQALVAVTCGQSSTISPVIVNVVPAETTLTLSWQADKTIYNNYTVTYGVGDDLNKTWPIPDPTDGSIEVTIDELDAGQQYNFKLYGFNKDKDVELSDFVQATKPYPPSDVNVTEAGNASLTVTWLPSEDSLQYGYVLTYKDITVPSITHRDLPVNDTEVTIPGLGAGHTYTITVAARSFQVESNKSVELTDNTVPFSPLSVTARAVDGATLQVNWAPQPDSYQDVYEVRVLYEGQTDDIQAVCSPTNQTTCTITAPGDHKPGEVYIVRVKAVKGQHSSSPISTSGNTKPLPPTSLTTVNVTSDMLHLTWIPPASSLDGYQISIYPGDSGNSVQNKTDLELSVIFSGLVPGRRYSVSIISLAGVEQSVTHSSTFWTVPNPPNASVDLRTNDTIVLSWTMPPEEVSSYAIDAKGDMDSRRSISETVPGNETGVTLRDLLPGDTYIITVIAISGEQSSPPTTLHNVTAHPNPVFDMEYVADLESVLVSWSRPASLVEEYKVDITGSLPGYPMFLPLTESLNISGLTPGVQYTVTVHALSGSRRGQSEPVSLNITTIPSSVGNLSVLVGTNTATVSWTVPEGISYHYLNLTISGNDHSESHIISPGEMNSHLFDDLKPGRIYQVSIITALIDGPSGKPVETTIATKPLPVTDLRADPPSTDGVTILWSAGVGSSQDGFKINIIDLDGIGVPQDVDTTEQTYPVTDLLPGHLYNITVLAYTTYTVSGVQQKQFGDGQYLNLTTRPLPVMHLNALIVLGRLNITWYPPGSIQDAYLIKYRSVLRDPTSSWKNQTTLHHGGQNTVLYESPFPGEKYEVEVYSISRGHLSDLRSTGVVNVPLAPQDVTVLKDRTTTDRLYIEWVYENSQTYANEWNVTFGSQELTVPKPQNTYIIQAELPGLRAGETYVIDVYSITEGERKSTSSAQANGTVKPVCDTELLESDVTNTSLCLNYSENSPTFNSYLFQLEGQSPITQDKTETRRVCFSELTIPGKMYQINVSVISVDVTSDPQTFSFRTIPNKAVLEWEINETIIQLTLIKPAIGLSDFYNISCRQGQGTEQCGFHNIRATDEPQVVNFTGLKPFVPYDFEVLTISGDKFAGENISQQTQQSKPSIVRDVTAKLDAPNTVLVKWEKPEQLNGVLQKYRVNYTGVLEDDYVTGEEEITVGNTHVSMNFTFNDLKAGYKYTFQVRAFTVSYGPPGQHVVLVNTYPPPYNRPTEEVLPKKIDQPTPTSIKLKFVNAFSDKGGRILYYTIIVSKSNSTWGRVLPGWRSAQNDPAIKAYQAIENCVDFFDSNSDCSTVGRNKRSMQDHQEFTVGTETGCDKKDYCNGPLNPDTEYYIALRAFTTAGPSDTPYSTPIKTAARPAEEDHGPLIGGIIAAVLLLLLIVVIVVVYQIRKRRPSMYKKDDHEMHEGIPVKRSSSRRTRASHNVKLVDFPEHFRSMSADSDYRFAEEFEELREVGREQSCNAAEFPQNRAKNRFTNILPYDHSRVKLLPTDDEEGSDYINSNYMPGYNSRREYIVTQGPLPSTRDDFWRLLWEQNACNIVMLTRCMEKGREKCDHYWPQNSETMFYGDLQVAILNETKFPDWTITEFRVSLGDNSRKVRHFHYTAWPDFGVPERPNSLVKFVNTARGKITPEAGPIIVHCSAGVGRSGTFIGLDRILQHIKQNDWVDIYSVVHEMRRHRVWMVQTEQQYICIHQCLLSVLQGFDDEPIYCNQIHDNVGFEDDEGINVEIM